MKALIFPIQIDQHGFEWKLMNEMLSEKALSDTATLGWSISKSTVEVVDESRLDDYIFLKGQWDDPAIKARDLAEWIAEKSWNSLIRQNYWLSMKHASEP